MRSSVVEGDKSRVTPSVDTGMSPPTQQTYGEVLLLKTSCHSAETWKSLRKIYIYCGRRCNYLRM